MSAVHSSERDLHSPGIACRDLVDNIQHLNTVVDTDYLDPY